MTSLLIQYRYCSGFKNCDRTVYKAEQYWLMPAASFQKSNFPWATQREIKHNLTVPCQFLQLGIALVAHTIEETAVNSASQFNSKCFQLQGSFQLTLLPEIDSYGLTTQLLLFYFNDKIFKSPCVFKLSVVTSLHGTTGPL